MKVVNPVGTPFTKGAMTGSVWGSDEDPGEGHGGVYTKVNIR